MVIACFVLMLSVYIGEESTEEPDFQYIPDTHHITTSLPHGSDPLAGSLLLLAESLESGAALAQFEVQKISFIFNTYVVSH